MPSPALSILIGAYNCPRYLPAAITSILNQTFRDFELLLIDDGSTDRRTPALLKKFARRDSRIRIITAAHSGIVGIRNIGLAEAAAPLIGCMDQDDCSLPDRFAAQVAFLEQHPEVAVVGGWQETMDAAGRPIRTIEAPTQHTPMDDAHLSGVTTIGHPTALYRAQVARAVGGYLPQTELAEDLDLWLRIAEVARIANLPKVLLRYRVHSASTSSLRHQRQLAVIHAACAAAWQRRGIPPRNLATQSWRPDHSRHSRRNFDLGQGWSAFQSGHRKTALVFGAKTVARHPLHRPAWKLLACAALKATPRSR